MLLQRAKGSGTIEEQLEAVRETCKIACKLIEAGHTIAITTWKWSSSR